MNPAAMEAQSTPGLQRVLLRVLRGDAPFVLGAVALSVTVVLAAALFAALFQARLASQAMPRESAQWAVYQVGFEHQRLRVATTAALAERDAELAKAAAELYEIFVSRVILLGEGRPGLLVSGDPHAAALLEELRREVAKTDEQLAAARTPLEQAETLDQAVRAMEPLVYDVTLQANRTVTVQESRNSENLDRLSWRLAALFAGVCVAVLGFALLVGLQIRRLRRSQESLRRLGARLEQEKLRAEQASRVKSAFLANMSHELRTPLNAIIGFAEMIVFQVFGPMQPQRYAEYVADIRRSGQHLLSLVNDLLDLAKVESGGMQLEWAELDPRSEAETAVRALATEAATAGVRVSIDSTLIPLRADRRALRQMLLNLLSNAIKFTPAGGTIRVGFEQGPQSVAISVSDEGIGAPAEELAKLLEPFAQGAAKPLLGQKGTGLGLSITRNLMELHGGRIELSSAPGAGLTATLIFPTKPEPPAARLAA